MVNSNFFMEWHIRCNLYVGNFWSSIFRGILFLILIVCLNSECSSFSSRALQSFTFSAAALLTLKWLPCLMKCPQHVTYEYHILTKVRNREERMNMNWPMDTSASYYEVPSSTPCWESCYPDWSFCGFS